MKVKKKTVIHFILIVIGALCISFIFYWRNKTLIYHSFDIELYIDQISENQIIVKNPPYSTRSAFNGEYIIQINEDLTIKDSKGGDVDVQSLKRGDILLFDYTGPIKFKNATAINFKNNTVLNGEKINAFNFRLSDEKLNMKFWRLEE